jgi:hypothetical protein
MPISANEDDPVNIIQLDNDEIELEGCYEVRAIGNVPRSLTILSSTLDEFNNTSILKNGTAPLSTGMGRGESING